MARSDLHRGSFYRDPRVGEILRRLLSDLAERGHILPRGNLPLRRSSLAVGDAGVALALAYGARAFALDPDATRRLMLRSMRRSIAVPMTRSLFWGRSGVAWVARHIDKLLGEDRSSEFVDLVVSTLRTSSSDDASSEWMLGQAGLLFLSQEIGPRASEVAARAVTQIQKNARFDGEGGCYWQVLHRPSGELVTPLGIAHGQAGIMLALIARIESTPGDELARDILRRAAGWLYRQRRMPQPRCLFPVNVGDARSDDDRTSGWCNGDMGPALALYRAGSLLGVPEWRALGETAAAHLMSFAAEASCEPANRDNPSLCHGLSGYALFAASFHRMTGRPLFRDAADRYVARLLAIVEPQLNRGGVLIVEKDGDYVHRGRPRNFLMGSAGVFLSLGASTGYLPGDFATCLGFGI